MFQEDVTLVRKMIKEEIAEAIVALRASLKPVKAETPKPVEVEVKAEVEAPKKAK